MTKNFLSQILGNKWRFDDHDEVAHPCLDPIVGGAKDNKDQLATRTLEDDAMNHMRNTFCNNSAVGGNKVLN